MQLTLNGTEREVAAATVAELLDELGLRREVVVVERNEEVIPRAELERVRLLGGDQIEIIQMIAGG